jgi:Zn finger protein HypA/HybF involved in hydrogenase expression
MRGSASLRRGTQEEKGATEMEAYCLKCRTKREMSDPAPVTMKNGKTATRGKCPVCGTQMYRIGKS